jgi:rhodanese-related sulfurtransferase
MNQHRRGAQGLHRVLTLATSTLALLAAAGCRPAATEDPGAGSSAPPAPATFESPGRAGNETADQTRTLPAASGLAETIDVATLSQIKEGSDIVLIDVREPDEYAEAHIPGVILMPLGDVPNRVAEIPKDKTVILTCRTGNRSGQAATWLRGQGYSDVHNLQGGILAWQKAGLPTESGAP